MKRKIESDVLEILNRSNITGDTLVLPDQLERKLYERTNKVITNHGGKWNKSAKAHVFPGDAREALGMALTSGETENQQQAKQAFFTPAELVERMIELACVKSGDVVLEPSAGVGNIALPLYDLGCEVHCIEIDKKHHDELNAKCLNRNLDVERMFLNHADFMEKMYNWEFDAIVMNPPFTKSQDVKHILHAWQFLKPGGRLVAIASSGVKFRTTKLDLKLRELIEKHGEIHDLPAGTFKESGTSVNTVLIKLRCNESFTSVTWS